MKILFLGAHPDDEQACAGTLARFCEEKHDVYYATFSFCDEAMMPLGFAKDVLFSELMDVAEVLGIKKENMFTYNYQVRWFPHFRQQILEEIVRLKGMIEPDLVLAPCTTDLHQDHEVVSAEAMRAFKRDSIIGYELPQHNFQGFNYKLFVPLTEKQVQTKIEAMSKYVSQSKNRSLFPDTLRSLSIVRGAQVKTDYAESFEVMRLVYDFDKRHDVQ